jgi:hypothetical protein
LSAACYYDPGDPNNNNNISGDQPRNENWLLGIWEGKTPVSSDPVLSNKKIRIEITEVQKKIDEEPQVGQKHRVFAYSVKLTWDVDGTPWIMSFDESEYSQSGLQCFTWESLTMRPSNQFMENISIRVRDTMNVDPHHNFNLDWQLVSNSSTTVSYLDVFGDIEIKVGGTLFEIQFPPQPGSYLRLNKK